MIEEKLAQFPAKLWPVERRAVYDFIVKTKPTACLEVGTWEGGSAAVIVAALDTIDQGTLDCVSLGDHRFQELWQTLAHRATYHEGNSRSILPMWFKANTKTFDFAFIDGDHTTKGVLADILNTAELMPNGGNMLLHDVIHPPIALGIQKALKENNRLTLHAPLVTGDQLPEEYDKNWNGIGWIQVT